MVIRCDATLTLLFCPPLRPFRNGVPIRVFDCDARPKSQIRLLTRSLISLVEIDLLNSQHTLRSLLSTYREIVKSAAKRSVSCVVKDPINVSSCSTYALIARNEDSGCSLPFTSTRPVIVPGCLWASVFSKVDLPDPEGPINAMISPVLCQ